MTQYRPISKISKDDPDLDTLHEGVEPWMVDALLDWLHPFLWSKTAQSLQVRTDFLQRLGLTLRLRPALNFDRAHLAVEDLKARFRGGGMFGMDVIGYAVSVVEERGGAYRISRLNEILSLGGSVWDATKITEGEWRLTRRDLKTAKDAISGLDETSPRAHELLVGAWAEVATRDPDPNAGYDRTVKAVEAAAQPVISPANSRATLGTLIADMKAKPSKWTFELGDLDLVIAMSERLWKTHIRHGTDARTDHTLEEADAALHLAIPLVRFFAGGLVRQT